MNSRAILSYVLFLSGRPVYLRVPHIGIFWPCMDFVQEIYYVWRNIQKVIWLPNITPFYYKILVYLKYSLYNIQRLQIKYYIWWIYIYDMIWYETKVWLEYGKSYNNFRYHTNQYDINSKFCDLNWIIDILKGK